MRVSVICVRPSSLCMYASGLRLLNIEVPCASMNACLHRSCECIIFVHVCVRTTLTSSIEVHAIDPGLANRNVTCHDRSYLDVSVCSICLRINVSVSALISTEQVPDGMPVTGMLLRTEAMSTYLCLE